MRLRWDFRLFLIGAAVLVGFLLNATRASALTWIFFHQGQTGFDAAHDLVGFIAFGISAALLLAVGALFDRWGER
jgi:exosortase/archaeosortase family protein